MAIKYIPYFPEPIEGQAILNNFKRTLRYKGADGIENRLRRGMPLYEVEKVESVGETSENNMLIRGECVSACAYLKNQGIEVDLVYIDPPFASGADYAKKVYLRRNPKVAEAIALAEQELEDEDLKSFEEKMYGDVWDKEKYLNWMYENLMAIKSVMSDTASIYVHLDWHIGHYVKILLDEIFGEEQFIDEIIWHYEKWTAGSNSLQKNHDTIYRYSKSAEYIFNMQKEITENLKKKYENGYLIGGGYGSSGLVVYDKTNPKVKEMIKSGKYKVVFSDMEGKPLSNVWKIPFINPQANERLGYSTQKPEALLERIIKASSNEKKAASNEKMVIADFFGGSGVTATVASKQGRQFIHCDIGVNSIQTTRDRLISNGISFDILEIKDGVSLYRNPIQTMDKIKSLIPGLKNEDALDAFWEGSINDSKYGLIPVYVPNLMDSTTKLLDEPLMYRILHEAIPSLDNSKIKKVIVYYIDIENIKAMKELIANDDSVSIDIELRDLKEILDDVIVEDYAEFSLKKQIDQPDGFVVSVDKFISDRVSNKLLAFNQKAMINSSQKKTSKYITLSESGLELIEFISVDGTSASGVWNSDFEIKIDKNSYAIINGVKTKKFWDGNIYCSSKPLRLKFRNICGDETIFTV